MNNFIGKWIAVIIGSIPIVYFIRDSLKINLTVYRKYVQGGQFTKDVSAEGKIVIITGANTGIGKETAVDLAERGAKVYLACRDSNRCEVARLEIIEKTGNKNVISAKLDLASLESVHEFVKQFLLEEKRLDILINNAGLICDKKTLTIDGFETTIAVNHLGHFLLTNLLLDTLKASGQSRIINVSGRIHKHAYINQYDILYGEQIPYKRIFVYAQSKLANILFTRELAKRLRGTRVTANSLHPGVVRSDLCRNLPYPMRCAYFLTYPFLKNIKSGAQTTLAIALDPDFQNVSGKYFSDCKIAHESKAAQNDEMAKWLWEISEKCTKLK